MGHREKIDKNFLLIIINSVIENGELTEEIKLKLLKVVFFDVLFKKGTIQNTI